jgi:hypothetical protein
MAQTFKWATPGSWAAGFASSDLNSCANGSVILSSLTAPQVDNRTTLQLYVQFEFVGGSISPAAAADVVAFLLPLDSTAAGYVDGEAGATVINQPVWLNYPYAAIGLRLKATSTQLQQSGVVLCPPGGYKIGLLNRAGVTLAASGNQLNWRFHSEASA